MRQAEVKSIFLGRWYSVKILESFKRHCGSFESDDNMTNGISF